MEKDQIILGVDVSKSTLDIYCSAAHRHIRIRNSAEGFRILRKWCRGLACPLEKCMVVMEHTGGYEYRLIQYCQDRGIAFCRVPGLAIKRSLGIARGKNDRVDAMRIARYAEEKHTEIKASGPLNPAVRALREQLSLRKRLVREEAGYKSSLSERKHMFPELTDDLIAEVYREKIRENGKLVKKVEAGIMAIIRADKKMETNYLIITSLKGIGPVNAAMTIAYTENFLSFTDARSYAVYCGVVPFDNSSGKFIGRKKVSTLANRELKQELSQAARPPQDGTGNCVGMPREN